MYKGEANPRDGLTLFSQEMPAIRISAARWPVIQNTCESPTKSAIAQPSESGRTIGRSGTAARLKPTYVTTQQSEAAALTIASNRCLEHGLGILSAARCQGRHGGTCRFRVLFVELAQLVGLNAHSRLFGHLDSNFAAAIAEQS